MLIASPVELLRVVGVVHLGQGYRVEAVPKHLAIKRDLGVPKPHSVGKYESRGEQRPDEKAHRKTRSFSPNQSEYEDDDHDQDHHPERERLRRFIECYSEPTPVETAQEGRWDLEPMGRETDRKEQHADQNGPRSALDPLQNDKWTQ